MGSIGEHAVVLGAGLAGLLTARVLSEAYERVTIVERDELPDGPDGPDGADGADGAAAGRKGVPQGRHTHLLLPRGREVVEELLPGITADLEAGGAVVPELGPDSRLVVGGHRFLPTPTGARGLQATRPFLEAGVRRAVLALHGVRAQGGCDVLGLATTPDRRRITGVRLIRRSVGSTAEEVAADLVVDATGSGGRTAHWLSELGYEPAPVEELRVDVGYATRWLRLPAYAGELEKVVLVGPKPGRPRGMALLRVEGDRILMTITSIGGGTRPPLDPEGFRAYAEGLAPPDVWELVRDAEPLGEITPHRFTAARRRRYERVRDFPAGLLVTGDALCSLDPIYAQGMATAALEADALRRCLREGPDRLRERWFRAAARVVANPWRMSTAADLAVPEIDAPRPRAIRALNAYLARVYRAAAHDEEVARRFVRVFGLMDEPTTLLTPAALTRVLRAAPAPVANRSLRSPTG